eukprot:CAMPEP_0201940614 /NCGR_PEP_ID=MMETSP0903-20130614/45543_1 /ASSEMBLY_ACC=CAM_ASM_000552 /TAXON_ID=420261 /ORGANISM="Thalassiosira antarctica, Strain CCMP982" /LENGTH=242 /DNA_ID=CAMNT_0048482457 /DNA_START=17 /DNA_END=745 /DNA_ORIENTATION=-
MTMTTAATATSANSTPAIELLTLLHQYESLHCDANDNLKSSIWNITKARRERAYQVGGGFVGAEYSADDVREELRAQALLEWKEGDEKENGSEPKLVNDVSDDEDGGLKNNGSGSSGGRFVLHLDGMKAANQEQHAAREKGSQEQINIMTADNKENEGLRQRRGNVETDDKWTSEEPTGAMDDEEERLRYADPLNLFGVPPPALRVAQAKSRSAIAYYVEVANLAREIMKITNNQNETTGAD